jgi:TetR/AcrR family transcriptional repressor of bet genes
MNIQLAGLTIWIFSNIVKRNFHLNDQVDTDGEIMTNSSVDNATSRAEQKQLTRQTLLDATIDLIADQGISGVTLAKVAERTGLSQGICNFHFRAKEQLMLEAFRMLYREHSQVWRTALNDLALSPVQRLTNLVEKLLSPPLADPRKLAVWLAFWGETPHRRTYLELCSEGDRDYEVAIEGLLRQLSSAGEALCGMSLAAIAVALTGMIDGFHLQYLIAPGRLTCEAAIRACLVYLSGFFPEFNDILRERS